MHSIVLQRATSSLVSIAKYHHLLIYLLSLNNLLPNFRQSNLKIVKIRSGAPLDKHARIWAQEINYLK